MTVVEHRLASKPTDCPYCPDTIPVGGLICVLVIGTTETSACFSCWIDRDDGRPPVGREAST